MMFCKLSSSEEGFKGNLEEDAGQDQARGEAVCASDDVSSKLQVSSAKKKQKNRPYILLLLYRFVPFIIFIKLFCFVVVKLKTYSSRARPPRF